MKTGLGLVVGLLLVGGWTLGAQTLLADTQLRFITSEESVNLVSDQTKATTGEMTIWLGPGMARVERPDEIILFHQDPGTIIWIDPQTHTYQQTATPFRLHDVVPVARRRSVASLERTFSKFAAVTSRDGGMIGDWPTTITTVTAERPKSQARFTVESWMTGAIRVNIAPYNGLLRWDAELDPLLRSWFPSVVGLTGVMVRRRTTYATTGHRLVATSQLLAVEIDLPADPQRFAVPEDYEPVPLDGTRRFDAVLLE